MTEEIESAILSMLSGDIHYGLHQDEIAYGWDWCSQVDVIKTLEKLVNEGKVVACYNYMEQKMTFKLPEVEDV